MQASDDNHSQEGFAGFFNAIATLTSYSKIPKAAATMFQQAHSAQISSIRSSPISRHLAVAACFWTPVPAASHVGRCRRCLAVGQAREVSEKAPLVVVGSVNADMVLQVDRIPAEGETLAAVGMEVFPGGKVVDSL